MVGIFGNGIIHVDGRSNAEAEYQIRSEGITEQFVERGILSGRMKKEHLHGLMVGQLILICLMSKRAIPLLSDFRIWKRKIIDRQLSCLLPIRMRMCILFYERDLCICRFRTARYHSRSWITYRPSIEDKIVTFGERERHQLFLEAGGMDKTNGDTI